jgi:hypothetical protein
VVAGTGSGGRPGPRDGPAGSELAAAGRQVWARIVWVGVSRLPAGWVDVLVSWRSRSFAVGRFCGSLARAASIQGRSESGTAAMSGSVFMIR